MNEVRNLFALSVALFVLPGFGRRINRTRNSYCLLFVHLHRK